MTDAQISLNERLTLLRAIERLSKKYSPYRFWDVTVWELRGGNPMTAAKRFFEQIPIETVKRIAREFPGENANGSDGGIAEVPDEVTSPREDWRELAQKLQHEQDPKRLVELVDQLIVTLDQEQVGKSRPFTGEVGSRFD